MDNHAPRHDVTDLISSMHTRFGENIKSLGPEVKELLDRTDLNCRLICGIRDELLASSCTTISQEAICEEILEEVFTDLALAMYLLTIGLIVPGRMSLRRALELSVSAIFMWDLPHEYWGWRKNDADLSFSNMITHLTSYNFGTFMENTGQKKPGDGPLLEQSLFQDLYRSLSNTVHGKIEGKQPLSPDRFSIEKNGVQLHLLEAIKVQEEIIVLFSRRFSDLKAKLSGSFPQMERLKSLPQ